MLLSVPLSVTLPAQFEIELFSGTVWLHPEHTRRVRSADQSSVISSVVRLRKSATLQLSVLRLVHTACTCLFRAPAEGILNGIPSSVLHMTNLNLRNGPSSEAGTSLPFHYSTHLLHYLTVNSRRPVRLISHRLENLISGTLCEESSCRNYFCRRF